MDQYIEGAGGEQGGARAGGRCSLVLELSMCGPDVELGVTYLIDLM